jgi:hypothetical protein
MHPPLAVHLETSGKLKPFAASIPPVPVAALPLSRVVAALSFESIAALPHPALQTNAATTGKAMLFETRRAACTVHLTSGRMLLDRRPKAHVGTSEAAGKRIEASPLLGLLLAVCRAMKMARYVVQRQLRRR